MKKLETLRKELVNVSNDTLTAIVNCNDVDVANLTDNEKLAVLVFNEYKKALDNKLVTCVLDCNYSNSKLHNNEDEAENEFKVDYFRLIDEHNDSLARCYIHVSKSAVTTDIRFSAKKSVLAQAEKLEKMQFEIFRYKATQKVRNVRRQSVAYDEFVQTAKNALSILADSKKAIVKKTDTKVEKTETENK